MLKISLFGSPQIRLDGQEVRVPRRKSRALLYYLAAHSEPLSRERLLAFFWPDTPRPAAQQTLRTTLHGMRQVLGDDLIVEDASVALPPDAVVDVRLFERQLTPHNEDLQTLEAAMDLYRGDFLADFDLPGSLDFEDWKEIERERLRRLALRSLATLSRLYEMRGDYASALTSLDRALASNPLQEDLQRESIRLLNLAGDRPGAIRRYDSLRKLLDEEMGVPPMLETRQLYDAIIQDEPLDGQQEPRSRAVLELKTIGMKPGQPATAAVRPPGVDRRPYELPFIGRRAELQLLRDSSATRKLVLIEGEAGIGKTRLVEEYLRDRQAVLLAGAAHELEQAFPYQPVIDALRSFLMRPEGRALPLDLLPVWRGEIARLLPELSDSSGLPLRGTAPRQDASARLDLPAAHESRLWEAVNQLLIALSRQQPLIFFIDDLQWADASTLSLLGYLVRQVEGPVCFLATSRPVPLSGPLASLLQTLLRLDRLARVTLPRLSGEDVLDVARQISPVYAYPLADWLARSSEGNPYMLSELVRHGRELRVILPNGMVNLSALPASPVVPQTIYSLIQARLSRLSDLARRVLDAAVAMGREFDFEVVYQAAGLSEAAALDALDELRHAGLVYPIENTQEHPEGHLYCSFDHTLTIEVASREMGKGRLRLLHRRTAEALESIYQQRLDPVSAMIASHFTEGNVPERAAPYAFRAGKWAARLFAWKEAVEFFEQALASEKEVERRLEILMALGEAQFRAGEMAQASETFRAAAEAARPASPQRDHARLALAETLLPQARFDEAISLVQQILSEGRHKRERPEFAVQAEFTWGTALSLEGADLEAAAEHLNQAEVLSARQADPAHLAQIKFEQGSVAAQQGDLRRAIDLYRESLSAAEQAAANPDTAESVVPRTILAHNNLAYHLHLLGDPASLSTASEHAQAGLNLAREKGMLTLLPYLLSTQGEIALAEHDWETAKKLFEEGLALSERLSIPERIAGLTANLGLVAREEGDVDSAIHHLFTALTAAESLRTRHLAAQIRLWLAPLLPPAEAHRHLAEVSAIARSSGRRRLLEEAEHLQAALRLDDPNLVK